MKTIIAIVFLFGALAVDAQDWLTSRQTNALGFGDFFLVGGTNRGSGGKQALISWPNLSNILWGIAQAAAPASPWTNSNGTVSNTVSSTVSNFVFSSSVFVASGNLAEVKNAGTNVFAVSASGGIGQAQWWNGEVFGGLSAGISRADFSVLSSGGNASRSDLLSVILDDNYEIASEVTLTRSIADTNHIYTQLLLTAYNNSEFGTWNFQAGTGNQPNELVWSSGSDYFVVRPTSAFDTTAYTFGTRTNHTAGTLASIQNATTNILTFSYKGDITPGRSNSADIGSALLPFKVAYSSGFASYSTVATNAIGATGYTNASGVNQTAYVSATAAAFTVKDRAGTALYVSPVLTATVPVSLQPGWALTAASGLVGTVTPF